jgi:cell division transport system ATP-binding protein
VIKFDNVTKLYPRAVVALDNVTLNIELGEFVYLVGSNGSGKSTFLRLALREERATSGTIHVAGRDLTRLNGWKVPSLRRGIGMVFQDFKLLNNKTVYENVAFALQVTGRPRRYIKQTVAEMLDIVGLDGKEKRFPDDLSGGERQRVAIARAIVNRPPILLADEPTGNLDPTTSMGIMKLLDRINQTGTTVVMATHDDMIVNEMRRRVVELARGRVVSDVAGGVYGKREAILRDVGATPVLDAPGRGARQVTRRRITPAPAEALHDDALHDDAPQVVHAPSADDAPQAEQAAGD